MPGKMPTADKGRTVARPVQGHAPAHRNVTNHTNTSIPNVKASGRVKKLVPKN